MTRILSCDPLEQIMSDWNADVLKNFVKKLDLDVLSFDEQQPLRPRLCIGQSVR